jgi:hypothetical protein
MQDSCAEFCQNPDARQGLAALRGRADCAMLLLTKGHVVRQRIAHLTAASATAAVALSRIGDAVLARRTLPDPSLRLIEDLYPDAVARARFRAVWIERDIGKPDPSIIGEHFKLELVRELSSIVQAARESHQGSG